MMFMENIILTENRERLPTPEEALEVWLLQVHLRLQDSRCKIFIGEM